jgi:hypothetical protein
LRPIKSKGAKVPKPTPGQRRTSRRLAAKAGKNAIKKTPPPMTMRKFELLRRL